VTRSTAGLTLVCGACALLLAACGGDEAETAPQTRADTAPSLSTSAGSAAVGTDTAAPAPMPASPVADSAMASAILRAPATGPVNAQVVEGYQLTMDGLGKLVRAGRNLAALQARRPDLRDSMRLGSFDPNGIHDKLSRYPEVAEAIGEAGMTPREYATATTALMQAAMVREMRARGGSPQVQVNEANVRFVDEHWEEIQRMMRSAAAQVPQQQP
jgi:hypothetical protein